MFDKNSRYANVETVTVDDAQGRPVQAVKLRRLNETNGLAIPSEDHFQLDVMSQQQYQDPTKFWHIADANTELEANALVSETGKTIKVPER